jgi:hypothetical protein
MLATRATTALADASFVQSLNAALAATGVQASGRGAHVDAPKRRCVRDDDARLFDGGGGDAARLARAGGGAAARAGATG